MSNLTISMLLFISLSLLSNVYLFEQVNAMSQLNKDLCDRLNIIEFQLTETELTDCEAVYGR